MVAKIELVFNPAFVNLDNETTLANAVETGKVGSLEVDKDSFKVLGKDAYIIIDTHLLDPKEYIIKESFIRNSSSLPCTAVLYI